MTSIVLANSVRSIWSQSLCAIAAENMLFWLLVSLVTGPVALGSMVTEYIPGSNCGLSSPLKTLDRDCGVRFGIKYHSCKFNLAAKL